MADSSVEFDVRGIESDEEGQAIESELQTIRGVQMVEVDRESGRVEVRYGEELLSEEDIKSAVRDVGYEVE